MAEDQHLSLMLMAKLLTNSLEFDELVDHVAPHLLRRCPECWAVQRRPPALSVGFRQGETPSSE